jgi:hypothetical protein
LIVVTVSPHCPACPAIQTKSGFPIMRKLFSENKVFSGIKLPPPKALAAAPPIRHS